MTDLLLQPAPAGRNEYEVIIADGGQIVGRIALFKFRTGRNAMDVGDQFCLPR